MKKITEIEKHKKNVRIATIGCSSVAFLLVCVFIWHFGSFGNKQPIVPFNDNLVDTMEIDEVILPDVVVQPIDIRNFQTPAPYVPVGDEGGIPVTNLAGELDDELFDNPEQAVEVMIEAVEDILAGQGVDIADATTGQIEKAVETVNNQNQTSTGTSGGSSTPKNGDTKTENGTEYFFAFGSWHEVIPGEGGTAYGMVGGGEKIGY